MSKQTQQKDCVKSAEKQKGIRFRHGSKKRNWQIRNDPIIIADDFDGCFCQECFDEPANEFLELIYAFIDSSDQAEANELFSQIEDLSESLGLSEDGQDILFGFLNHKLSEMQSLQDIDINMINEHTNRIQSMP